MVVTDNGAVGLIAPWMAATPSRSATAASPEPMAACCQAAAESAESPHCTALHVATVRYIVEKKWAVTCDDAQRPWSRCYRYLLCKQGVVGSSPIVSTSKCWSAGCPCGQNMLTLKPVDL